MIEFTDDFDLFNLFISKEVKIVIKDTETKAIKSFVLRVPSIRDFYINNEMNALFAIWSGGKEMWTNVGGIQDFTWNDFLSLSNYILFVVNSTKQFFNLSAQFKKGFNFFFPSIDWEESEKNKALVIAPGVTMTKEICNYCLYILKLSCGEEAEAPKTFSSKEAEQFYLAQEEMKAKVRKLRSQTKNEDALLKTFLSIEYSFPSFSHEYLLNQTMAQICWLRKYAGQAASYEVNATAFATGNMKKGSKLDFFIK